MHKDIYFNTVGPPPKKGNAFIEPVFTRVDYKPFLNPVFAYRFCQQMKGGGNERTHR